MHNKTNLTCFGFNLAFQVIVFLIFLSIAIAIPDRFVGYGFLEFNIFNKYLILMTAFIFPLITIASFKQIKSDHKLFQLMLSLSFVLVLGTFLSQNLLYFYMFWESSIIPLFFIIGIWGGKNRIYATFKFVLFTAIGSLMMLAAILYLGMIYYQTNGTLSFNINDLATLTLPLETQRLLFLGFALAFIIKIPVPPFHHWLPYAHVEAPAAGSMLLAAILLKMGSYGFLRFNMTLFPLGLDYFKWPLAIFFVAGAIYASLVAFAQNDLKKIVAYSSIGHMGILMYAIVVNNQLSVAGSMVAMVGHGLTSAGLFYLIGVLYDRYHVREIDQLTALSTKAPALAVALFVIALASVGFPLTVGFSSEFLMYAGIFRDAITQATTTNKPLILALISITTILMGTLYTFRFLKHTLWGEPSATTNGAQLVLSKSELLILIALILGIVVLGLYPNLIIKSFLTSGAL